MAPVTIRHIKRLDVGFTGAAEALLGRMFEPFTAGLNDEQGWQLGTVTERMSEEGEAKLVFPNAAGSDAVQHRNRFGVVGAIAQGAPSYMPGDEYVEVKTGSDLLFVGTPVIGQPNRAALEIELKDPWWLQRKQREYLAGFWHHAPRDVWEHYTQAWVVYLADDFDSAPDGRFTTSGLGTGPAGHVRLDPGTASVSILRGASGGRSEFSMGWDGSEPHSAWQLKVQLTRSKFGDENEPPYGDNAYVRVGMYAGGAPLIFIQLKERTTTVHGPTFVPGGDDFVIECNPTTDAGDFEVIVEGRDRWVFFFLNQALVYVLPMPEAETAVPFVSCRAGDGSSTQYVDVDNFVFRRTQPFLMKGSNKGDYHLPGAPPPGGLWAKYYDDSEARGTDAFQETYASKQFSPFHDEPALERLDPVLNFTASGGFTVDPVSKWQPRTASPDGLWWSVRWTGSIYLELGDSDMTLQYVTQEEGCRMWVGKTRFNEVYLDNWLTGLGSNGPGAGLRSHIGQSVNGWYPIVIEYGQRGTPGAEFALQYGGGGVVPTSKLSPYGVFDDQIRNDSHYEAIRTLIDTFGYQTRFEPAALEDAAFPGTLAPKIKVGRDSNKILTQDENESFGAQVDASEVALAVLGDASGMALDENGGSLTAEVMDYQLAEAATMLLSEYDQASDISHAPLLAQRLRSFLYLRSSGWQTVGVQPPGIRELTDTFPITGAMALLEWNAGDGVRLNLPRVGVVDGSPRQILSVTRNIFPVALGSITVGFKSRPRDLKELFRRMQRMAVNRQRKYQGQYITHTGSLGVEATTEDISWLALPPNLQKVKEAIVTVVDKPDEASRWIWINDKPTHIEVIRPGRFDVSQFVDYYDGLDLDRRSPVMKIEMKLFEEE